MTDRVRELNKTNINSEIEKFISEIKDISLPSDSKGIDLLLKLKRNKIGSPSYYKDVSYFEGANRIMTDLIILYGVRWLLERSNFEFEEYVVEFGNENKRDHDVMSMNSSGSTLTGEAFNVAESFFQGKKSKMLSKLRDNKNSNYKLILVNEDAVKDTYTPKLKSNEYLLFVDIFGEKTKMHQAM